MLDIPHDTPKKRDSAVSQAAAALRSYALAQKEGTFLGSEEDLIERLQVSRPTLRQASARVVQEHLISIRRGVGGGYFAREPGSMSVSRIAALYLMSRDAGLSEIIAAIRPLRSEQAMLAAACGDDERHAELRQFLIDDEIETDSTHGYRDFLRSEREFGRLLARMANNAVLTLLIDILYDLTAHLNRDQDVFINRPKRVLKYRELRRQLGRAILEGDSEVAKLFSHRRSELIGGWMREDFKDTRFGDTPIEAA